MKTSCLTRILFGREFPSFGNFSLAMAHRLMVLYPLVIVILPGLGVGDYLLAAAVGTLERKAQTVSIKSLSCTSITVSDIRSTRYRVLVSNVF